MAVSGSVLTQKQAAGIVYKVVAVMQRELCSGDIFVFSITEAGTSANSVAASGRLTYRAGGIGWGIMATGISMVLNDLGVLNMEG